MFMDLNNCFSQSTDVKLLNVLQVVNIEFETQPKDSFQQYALQKAEKNNGTFSTSLLLQ